MTDTNWTSRLIDPVAIRDLIEVPLAMDLVDDSFDEDDPEMIVYTESVPGLIREVLGDKLEQAHAFTYMFRRFGLPNMPSFSHAEIARYRISTPMPDMTLEISPKSSGNPDHCFRFMVPVESSKAVIQWIVNHRDDKGKPRRHKDWRNWPDDDPLKAYALAAEATLLDLLRPVDISDHAINLLGPVDIDPSHEVLPPAASSGHPLPIMANEDPRRLHQFHRVVLSFGHDNMWEGIKKIVKLLPETND